MPRVLCVCAVSSPGGAEIGLARLLRRLEERGWRATVTTPRDLRVGGLDRGAGARAVLSWPKARRLAREHDVVYLNGGVPGRLLPALRGFRTVLHVHDLVERVPRHWRAAGAVLADSQAVPPRLPPPPSPVLWVPGQLPPPALRAPGPASGAP